MLIPLRPEDGVDHFPYATFGLMALCIIAFIGQLTVFDGIPRDFVLEYGELNPVQWFTSAFLHVGVLHLLGNMFFLFVFGIVVEGLVGWPKFLALVAGAMAIEGLIVQFMMLDFAWTEEALEAFRESGYRDDEIPKPGALGASGFIYALMVAALIWVPRHRILVFMLIYLSGRLFPVRVMVFALLYVLWDLYNVLKQTALYPEAGVTTAWLHVIGAFAGGVIATVMLVSGAVDTGGWHLFGDKAHNRRSW